MTSVRHKGHTNTELLLFWLLLRVSQQTLQIHWWPHGWRQKHALAVWQITQSVSGLLFSWAKKYKINYKQCNGNKLIFYSLEFYLFIIETIFYTKVECRETRNGINYVNINIIRPLCCEPIFGVDKNRIRDFMIQSYNFFFII